MDNFYHRQNRDTLESRNNHKIKKKIVLTIMYLKDLCFVCFANKTCQVPLCNSRKVTKGGKFMKCRSPEVHMSLWFYCNRDVITFVIMFFKSHNTLNACDLRTMLNDSSHIHLSYNITALCNKWYYCFLFHRWVGRTLERFKHLSKSLAIKCRNNYK